ncbi:DUF5959 family protein [Kitasatospora sp. NPDC036755]|uniref:DUF5959 family protein n=1 Tax=Kitasatospora sp. NPDC036755 TaxID=3154600 RepID=UPI0033C66D1F
MVAAVSGCGCGWGCWGVGCRGCSVFDPGRSGVRVFIPLCLEEGWIDEQRGLLGRVRTAWPGEVLESSPGVWEWRR